MRAYEGLYAYRDEDFITITNEDGHEYKMYDYEGREYIENTLQEHVQEKMSSFYY